MNAGSVTTKAELTHCINLQLVYPPGERPPGDTEELPPDYAIGQIYDSQWEFSGEPPSLGATFYRDGAFWTIKAIEQYQSVENLETQNFWVIYCTKDDSDVQPFDWDGQPPIRWVVADEDGFVLNNWGCVDNGALNPLFHDDPTALRGKYITQYFVPIDGRCPQVRIYWA
jgi:hypothetical protein